ncbi:MAG: ATP-dependent Clp protease proteolytic subunit [Parvularculaceae bacterium]|nr:ATP-dependent Clp protease proteolytic subunit [Parvularculaceae bacterium]
MRPLLQRLMLAATLAMLAAAAMLGTLGEQNFLKQAPTLVVREEGAAQVFYWRGEVAPGMAQRFAEAFDAARGQTRRIVIDLDSPGGMLVEGGRVVDIVRRATDEFEIETRVARGAKCLSMCVPIYLQGERRVAAPSALFMFHEPTTRDVLTDERVAIPEAEQRYVSERFFRRYFENSEMDPVWREKLRQQWIGRDVFKTARELVHEGANIVLELDS